MKNINRFILFDDNPSINILNKLIIKKVLDDPDIKVFDIPEEGLRYIASIEPEPDEKIILLLDINMLSMSCWEFLERFEMLDEKIKRNFNISILSAYIRIEDKLKAAENKYLTGLYQKPLTKELIFELIHQHNLQEN